MISLSSSFVGSSVNESGDGGDGVSSVSVSVEDTTQLDLLLEYHGPRGLCKYRAEDVYEDVRITKPALGAQVVESVILEQHRLGSSREVDITAAAIAWANGSQNFEARNVELRWIARDAGICHAGILDSKLRITYKV